MGQKNNVICSYLSEPAIFADFINGSIHNGERVVLPNQLSSGNAAYNQKEELRESDPDTPQYIERYRDTLKTVCNNNCYVVVGIESQDVANDTMPLRCMEYDVIEYKRQLKELGSKREKKLTGKEFLSGMAKDERLNPVTTIVFYHGEEPYDGCVTLHDMLELNGENKEYRRFVADYHINLVKAAELDEELFETGLHELIGFLKYRGDKQGLLDYIDRNEKRIQEMDEATRDVVNVMMSIPASVIEREKEMEGEEYSMCKALRDWAADERNAGLEEGKREGIKEGIKEGMKEGIKAGIKEGESRFMALTSALISADRLEDLFKATSDEAFRNSLYQEFVL